MPTVTVTPKTEAEKKLRAQVLLSQMVVLNDPVRRSVAAFAKRVGVSRQYIYKCMDEGRCTFDLANRLQKEFGKTVAPVDELCWTKINN
jgi:hypothetical protein